jgi:hypothetical protein
MRTISLLVAAALIAFAPAWAAAECTIERDAWDDAFRDAPSCGAAYRLFETCSYGAGADVPLGATVQEKCEADFLGKLAGAKKAAYRKQLAACDRKYAREEGSMYRSFAAFCRAGIARDYAKRYSKWR